MHLYLHANIYKHFFIEMIDDDCMFVSSGFGIEEIWQKSKLGNPMLTGK